MNWKDYLTLAGVGVLCIIGFWSCVAPTAEDPDPVVRETYVNMEERELVLEGELDALIADPGTPVVSVSDKRAELAAHREAFAAWEREVIKQRLGPVSSIVASIHPGLLPVVALGVNMVAGVMSKRGRKHAIKAAKDFSPWKNTDGTEFRPWEGVKSIARMNGWLHSSEASENAANGTAAPPGAAA